MNALQDLQDAIADYERPALAEWMKDHPMLGVILKAARRLANLEKLGLLSGTCDVWPVCSNCSHLAALADDRE